MTNADVARVADAMATVYATHSADTTVEALRAFFSDDHVHMAVVVDRLGFLVTTIELADLEGRPGRLIARQVGTLAGRVVRSADALRPVTDRLRRERRRRMAVVDDDGRLVGLLCLKRSGEGYCSDEGILARAAERRATSPDRGWCGDQTAD